MTRVRSSRPWPERSRRQERRHDVLGDDRAPAEEVAGVGGDRRRQHAGHDEAEETGGEGRGQHPRHGEEADLAAPVPGRVLEVVPPRGSATSPRGPGAPAGRPAAAPARGAPRRGPGGRSRRAARRDCSICAAGVAAGGRHGGLGPSPEERQGGDPPHHGDERAAQEEEAGEREHLLPDRRVLRREGAHGHRLPHGHERDPEEDLPEDEADAEVLDRVEAVAAHVALDRPDHAAPAGLAQARRGSRSRCPAARKMYWT